jgi:hypothetical protein
MFTEESVEVCTLGLETTLCWPRHHSTRSILYDHDMTMSDNGLTAIPPLSRGLLHNLQHNRHVFFGVNPWIG